MKKLLLTLFFIASLFANGAWALDLGAAKDQGLVGETPQGYLESVGSPTAETKSLIDDINAQRRQQYKSIAQKNGTTLAAVELVAGETAINKTRPGHYIKLNGAWKKK